MAREKRYNVKEPDEEFFTKFKMATVEAGTTIADVLREQARLWLQQFERKKNNNEENKTA